MTILARYVRIIDWVSYACAATAAVNIVLYFVFSLSHPLGLGQLASGAALGVAALFGGLISKCFRDIERRLSQLEGIGRARRS